MPSNTESETSSVLSATATPLASPTLPLPTPTVAPLRVSAAQTAPQQALDAAVQILSGISEGVVLVQEPADLTLSSNPTQPVETGAPAARLVYEHILVPVDRFSSLLDEITMDELRAVWSGQGTTSKFTSIYPSLDIMPDLEALLGPPGPAVRPQAADALDAAVWGDTMSIGILPFDALVPRLRALRLDGLSSVDNRLQQSDWPLATRLWLAGVTERGTEALAGAPVLPPLTNRDSERLTVLAMTGVTAMARGTAVAIEQAQDYAFPARQIGAELAAADITTTSNEIPFMEGCVANNQRGNVTFCSKPEYFATLELAGIDMVGLTGNHLNDFGLDAMRETLKLYEEKQMLVYGGGSNTEAAQKPLVIEHNGNRLAFLGANPFGPEYAWATADTPGSARFDRGQMIAEIQALAPQVDLVLAELQHTETDGSGEYKVTSLLAQVDDMRALFDAGAHIVTGVQAHAPQTVELRGEGIILYGLGNLFFDQTWSWPTRTGLIARHTIYGGRLLNTELLVTVIQDDMQLRWATPEERAEVLGRIFQASGY